MHKVVDYVVALADGVRKRHVHETARGEVVRFVVQLEARMGDEWCPIIRYDNAHGFAHRDLYEPQGGVVKEVLDLGLDAAMTLGDWDISENWDRYVSRFRKENSNE